VFSKSINYVNDTDRVDNWLKLKQAPKTEIYGNSCPK